MPEQGNGAEIPPLHEDGFFVVGIGASAGGIKALSDFFANVPRDSGMAYVVILHLSAQHESNLPALIQTKTSMPVSQVTESVEVEPNHVYVIPPSKYLVMMDGMIRLAEPERPKGAHTSIDLFFRTMAKAYGKDAIAIVLSGTGADGTLGLGQIKEEGGFVIAQDPAEAEYDDMPRSAINTSRVDLILPVAEMPARLVALRDGAERLQLLERGEEEAGFTDQDDPALRELLTILRVGTGNDFSHYKRPTLMRRIRRRMQVHELIDLSAYVAFVREHPDEVAALMRDLLITVTNFFRDHEAFEALGKGVVPALFAGKGSADQVRVWSAGCAGGEEAYSLAMILAEYVEGITDRPTIQIFATDIDERTIAEGRECVYPRTIDLDVSPERLRKFFIKEDSHYRIKKALRETVLFATHNITRDPPFSRLDLISCRNLLIYLNREMQERVLEVFHFALRPGGYLFLGSSESADATPGQFVVIDKKNRIYQRSSRVSVVRTASGLLAAKWPIKIPDTSTAAELRSPGQLHEEVVERLAPPSVLIDDDYNIIHTSAHAGRYMQVSGGEPSHNLLRLAHPDLRLDLRSALLELKMRETDGVIESRRLSIKLDGQTRSVTMTVRSVPPSLRPDSGSFLVTFDETTDVMPIGAPQAESKSGGSEVAGRLERELQRTKDQLRVTIEQYETSTEELRASNEELQAINEELRSATEELETSKEELQSVNEELTTVNQEYKEKIDEVGRANSDLQNLMASTDIGIVFLDRGLQIKRYTPPIQQLFNITSTDVGRPLQHFTHNLEYDSIVQDADDSLRTLRSIEREVRSTEGRWYLARVRPYRTMEDRIDGVVFTFVDITERKASEEQLREQAATLQEQTQMLNLAQVLVMDENHRIILWNTGCEHLYGYTSEEALGKNAHQLLKTEFSLPLAQIETRLRSSGQWQGELVHSTRDGTHIIVASHWILHQRDADEPAVILEVNNDITARRIAEDSLREADRNKDRFLLALGHELRNPLSAILSSVRLLERIREDSEAAVKARAIVERQLNHLVRLVDDLLDIEQLTRGKIELGKAPIEISAAVAAATEIARPTIDAHGHRLEVSIPKERIVVDGDLTRLGQVISNLLDNACKYSPAGSRIKLSAESSAGAVSIRVSDNGMGIAPEMLPRLFDLYPQGEPSPGAELQGFGIGLALVRQIVEMHGGTVRAKSEGVGKGSEFIVRLPLSREVVTG